MFLLVIKADLSDPTSLSAVPDNLDYVINAAVAKATEWSHVPAISADDFGPLLKNLRAIAPEETAKIEEVLDATNSMLAESDLFKELGTTGRAADTATDELDSIARAMLANGEANGYADAVSKATITNPGLANQYRNERRR